MSRLSENLLRAQLHDCVIGREIVVLDQATSTNDSILEMTTPATEQGLVVFAEYQTAGRGQRGNRWESAAHKGLWFSILLRPKIEMDKSPKLTAWAAKSVADTIQTQFSLPAKVKWPNDVRVYDRKVAGVLVEMRAQENAPHIAVLGIGINVNHAAENFPEEIRPRAISLAIALDRQVSREELAVALLRDLDQTYAERFKGGSSSPLPDVKNGGEAANI